MITLFAAVSCGKSETPPKNCTLYFVGEGVGIEPQSIVHGNYATAPENPEIEGYDFGGWFTDNDTFTNKWDFETDIVTQDTTLYAKWEEKTLHNYPIEIPFTEYSLAGTFCQWTNLNYDDKIIVINNNEKLANHINCLEGNCPEIDFSKYSLLLSSGRTNKVIFKINKHLLLQLSANKYKLDIEIYLLDADAHEQWDTALIVNKLKKENNIELKVILIYNY